MQMCGKWPIGVCSWSFQKDIDEIGSVMKALGVEHINLSIAPALGPDGDKYLEAVQRQGWTIYSGMMNYDYEDYSTLETIKVTGGIAPNIAGWVSPFAGKLSWPWEVARHRKVTRAVHEHDGRICMQILHTGRYAYHPLGVAPSKIKSPISPFAPRELSGRGVWSQIKAFANCAALARDAGYDGVEVMGYCPWSAIDLISTREGCSKRYGFIYVDREEFDLRDLTRYRKDSFSWYQGVIASNGADLS